MFFRKRTVQKIGNCEEYSFSSTFFQDFTVQKPVWATIGQKPVPATIGKKNIGPDSQFHRYLHRFSVRAGRADPAAVGIGDCFRDCEAYAVAACRGVA